MKAKLRRLPQKRPPVREKVREKPQKNHWKVTTAMAERGRGESDAARQAGRREGGRGTGEGAGRTTHRHEQQAERVLAPDETAVEEAEARDHEKLHDGQEQPRVSREKGEQRSGRTPRRPRRLLSIVERGDARRGPSR